MAFFPEHLDLNVFSYILKDTESLMMSALIYMCPSGIYFHLCELLYVCIEAFSLVTRIQSAFLLVMVQ